MVIPPLLTLTDEPAYREHYERTLCRGGIFTYDEIPVFFHKAKFDHAFFESSTRRGEKDVFSSVRAARMDWIAAALADPEALRVQGWIKKAQCHDPTRRVTVVLGDFVVVIALSKRRRDGRLKGNFITCYKADNSIAKILAAPRWTRQACLGALG